MKKNFRSAMAVIISVLLLTSCGEANVGENPNGAIHYDMAYYTFEETVIYCTNIFEGTFVSSEKGKNYTYYKFKVDKQLKGEIKESVAYVCEPNGICDVLGEGIEISYQGGTKYNVGEKYLLIGTKNVSVYEEDHYASFNKLLINLSDLKNAEIYGESLYKHSAKESFADISEMENYIQQKIDEYDGEPTEYIGREYLRSDDLEYIGKNSDIIVEVTPIKLKEEFEPIQRYVCRVEKIYKGELTETEINVDFFKDTVTVGQKYTVAITLSSIDNLYKFTSKHSLVTTENEVSELLKGVNG